MTDIICIPTNNWGLVSTPLNTWDNLDFCVPMVGPVINLVGGDVLSLSGAILEAMA